MRGLFMEPQNFTVNDGNGIRTLLFFAGCPLRCKWCSNPESQSANAGNDMVVGYGEDDILESLERQMIFLRRSGGGVTFSGGEATMQTDMLRRLVSVLYDRSVDMAIETCCHFEFDDIKDILERMNLIFADIKHMDDESHIALTGMSNAKILESVSRLKEIDVPVVVRIPVVGGANSDLANIRRTAEFVKTNLPDAVMELLPYHSFGDEKYEALNIEKPSREFYTPSHAEMLELIRAVENAGVSVISFR